MNETWLLQSDNQHLKKLLLMSKDEMPFLFSLFMRVYCICVCTSGYLFGRMKSRWVAAILYNLGEIKEDILYYSLVTIKIIWILFI